MAKKILIIEDSHFLSNILESGLQKNGFDVAVAFDGRTGLDKARSETPDLIILDLILPELPGEEVCRILKKTPETENIPVIILTSKDTEADRVIGKVLGAQAYIGKPFELDHLLKEMSRVLGVFAACVFLFIASTVFAAQEDRQSVPEGMELVKVGEHSVFVAKGTKIIRKGSQLILEPPDEFVARKILSLESDLAALKAGQEDLAKQIQDVRSACALASAASPEASGKEFQDGSK